MERWEDQRKNKQMGGASGNLLLCCVFLCVPVAGIDNIAKFDWNLPHLSCQIQHRHNHQLNTHTHTHCTTIYIRAAVVLKLTSHTSPHALT